MALSTVYIPIQEHRRVYFENIPVALLVDLLVYIYIWYIGTGTTVLQIIFLDWVIVHFQKDYHVNPWTFGRLHHVTHVNHNEKLYNAVKIPKAHPDLIKPQLILERNYTTIIPDRKDIKDIINNIDRQNIILLYRRIKIR